MEEKSVLFKTMPKDIRNILLTEAVTSNHHVYVLTIKHFILMYINNYLFYNKF